MKLYVTGFAPIPEHQELIDTDNQVPGYWVIWNIGFSQRPELTYPTEQEVQEQLQRLRALRVHDGRDHFCNFEVEQVGDRTYAIVCAEHPSRNHAEENSPTRFGSSECN